MKSIEIDRTKRLRDQLATGHNRLHPDIPAILEVDEGEEVVLETRDGVDGQLGPSTTAASMATMDAGAVHPITGPVLVKGARPGDLLVMPTLPMRATKIPEAGAPRMEIIQRAFEMLPNTAPFDVTGHPAMTLPCGLSDGLPAGLMLIGKAFDESTIYRAAHAFEQSHDWMKVTA